MHCLLCTINVLCEDVLNNHNVYFNDLFKPDTNYRKCDICQNDFGSLRIRKNHMFLFYYGQTGSKRGKSQLPINILKRGPIKYFTISYDQHKNFHNFLRSKLLTIFSILFILGLILMISIKYKVTLK